MYMTKNSDDLTTEDCLDFYQGEVEDDACEGAVEYRFAMSPTGISYPRCDKHHEARVDRQSQIVSRYGGLMDYTGYSDFGYADETSDY